jgi:hypothetical protein
MSCITNNAGEVGEKLINTSFAGTVLQGVPKTGDKLGTGIMVRPAGWPFKLGFGITVKTDKVTFVMNKLPPPDEQTDNIDESVMKYDLGDQATVFLVRSMEYQGMSVCMPGTSMRSFFDELPTLRQQWILSLPWEQD